MEEQNFADGIGGVSVVGTTVRIDFVALSPSEQDPEGKPKAVLQRRMIMSIEGFLHAAGKIQEVAAAIRKIGAEKLSEGQERALSRDASGGEVKAPAKKDGAGKGVGARKKGSDKPPFP